jgi:endo-1,4-beta-xylanase
MTMKQPAGLTSLLTAILITMVACTAPVPADTATTAEPSLQQTFGDHFMMGAALNEEQFTGRDARGAALTRHHFNTITPENVTKWEVIHPEPGRFDFGPADAFVAFGEANGMFMVGHTLVWHSQTPRWVFEDEDGNPATRELLLERMRDHIETVVGRYRGRIHAWDVVNEALNEDGSLRQSPWLTIIGEDYLEHAFRFAHEADPEAELYYNDYSLENAPKRHGAVRLVRTLQERGAPIHGIGTQGHFRLEWPTPEQLDSTIVAFAGLGIPVMVTELDIDVLPAAWQYQGADVQRRAELRDELNPYPDGLPMDVQQELAERYAELFRVFLNHRDSITRVTFWGVADSDSWLNNWPVPGRTNYPLLFDRVHQPKRAFDAVMETARGLTAAN